MKLLKKAVFVLLLFISVLCLSSCQESIESKYAKAQNLIARGNYSEAVKKLEELGTYEDSSKLVMYCRAAISGENGEFDAAFSTFRMLGEYKDSPLMIEYYKARQSELDYDENELSSIDSLLQAANMYDELLLFRDSKDRAESCRKKVYDKANQLAKSYDYTSAIMALRKLDDYGDSAFARIYYDAFLLEQKGCYLEASRRFGDVITYKDAKEQVEQVMQRGYSAAQSLEDSGDLVGAYNLFVSLADYKDSSEQANRVMYKQGEVRSAEQDWEAAIEAFTKAGTYKDASEKLKEVKYQYAKLLSDYGRTSEALILYRQIHGYKDVDEIIGPRPQHFSLTVAGSVSISGSLKKDDFQGLAGEHVFSGVLTPLKDRFNADANVIFLQNLLCENEKSTDYVSKATVASILSEAGINIAACGFEHAWDREEQGITSTRKILEDNGIFPVGIYNSEDHAYFFEPAGFNVAVLQYTYYISKLTRQKMADANQSGSIPVANLKVIEDDIASVRAKGAEIVIVLVNWGNKEDESQKELVQGIANAGADLIVGSGSLRPKGAEFLLGNRSDGQNVKVLCVWDLGTVLCGIRTGYSGIDGYLLHVDFTVVENKPVLTSSTYTPTYVWVHKTDKRYDYRCVPANETPPTEMAWEDIKRMEKSAEKIFSVLQNSPLVENR